MVSKHALNSLVWAFVMCVACRGVASAQRANSQHLKTVAAPITLFTADSTKAALVSVGMSAQTVSADTTASKPRLINYIGVGAIAGSAVGLALHATGAIRNDVYGGIGNAIAFAALGAVAGLVWFELRH